MKIYLIAIGTRVPGWVSQGVDEYTRRMPRHLAVELVEVPAVNRTKAADIDRTRREEGSRLLNRLPANSHIVALTEDGTSVSTRRLATELSTWMGTGCDVAFMIGGADGLSTECLDRADRCWSLSALTFPHALVRVIVAEQMFRAWTIISNHPYHRD